MMHALALVNGWWDAENLAGTVAAATHNAVMMLGRMMGYNLPAEKVDAKVTDYVLRDWGLQQEQQAETGGGFDVVKKMAVK